MTVKNPSRLVILIPVALALGLLVAIWPLV